MTSTSSPLTVIALDTATEVCSVALLRDGKVHEFAENVGQRHSERVLPMLQTLLAEAGLSLAQCSAIAFGAGPGSFTGLRIACGVAQGLAYGADLPVIAVPNLAALALAAYQQQPSERQSAARRIAVAIDARMNEAYWAAYHVEVDGERVRVQQLHAPALVKAHDLAAVLASQEYELVAGNALSVFAEHLPNLQLAQLNSVSASAKTIALLAETLYQQGAAVAPAEAAPLYVRDRVAQTIEERAIAKQQANKVT